MKSLVAVAAVVVGSGLGLRAYLEHRHTQIDETLPGPVEGLVVVRVPEGAVRIEGESRLDIGISGSVADGGDHLKLSSDRDHSEIRVTPKFRSADTGKASLTIRIPNGSSVDVETNGADVAVTGVQGVVRLESESGDLKVSGEPLGVMAISGSGDIDIDSERAAGLVHSEQGSVTIRGRRDTAMSTREMRDRYLHIDGQGPTPEVSCGDTYEPRNHGATHRGRQSYQRLSRAVESLVERIARDIDVTGFVDVDEHAGGVGINLSADIAVDPDDLAQILEGVQCLVGEGMILVGSELELVGRELQRQGMLTSR